MRRRVIFSVLLSGILIFGAVWFRTTRTARAGGSQLVAVTPTRTVVSPDEAELEDIYNGTSDSTGGSDISTSTEPLTDTDLISRQMLSDYVSLSANGQATQANLDALGDKYADDIVNLNKAPSILSTDLTSTINSKQSMQEYADAFAAIYGKYLSLETSVVKGQKQNPTDFDSSSASISQKMGDLYQREADELKAVPVPTALVNYHTEIVNRYLRDAWDMHALANLDTDPTDAYAALASQTNANADEQAILGNIEKVLNENGIMSASS